MRLALLGLCQLSLFLTSACGRATAEVPDSKNPLHCYVAFNYAWAIIHEAGPSHTSARLEATARAIYEMKKLRAAGRSGDQVTSAATDFANRHRRTPDVLVSLMKACEAAQNQDPEFQSQYAYLLSVAPKVDPDCVKGAPCAAGG